MNLRIGRATPSPTQLNYLQEAQSSENPLEKARFIMEVVRDEDLTSGSEELHPEWIEVYRSIREDIKGTSLESGLEKVFAHILESEDGISSIDPSSVSLAFLLGAGASKPKPSDIPTVAELLPDLLERGRRLDREDVNRLADFCETSRITNIEDLLTAAQLAEYCGRNPIVLRLIEFLLYRDADESRLRKYGPRSRVDIGSVAFLQDTLQVLFGLLSSRMLPAKPNLIHSAIADYVKSRSDSTIITTNYDCCIDLALGQDGKDFDYRMTFANSKFANGETLSNLIKLHGSLNWFYCDTCQKVNLIDISKAIRDFEADSSPYPVIGVCKGCGGQRRGLLVPPLAMKFDLAPALNPLLELANERLAKASVLVVVGFSFAEADQYISRMVSKWMQSNTNNRLVIFDPNRAVAEKMRKQCSVKIGNFDKSRVSWSGGDSTDEVPKFLKGELYKREMTTKKVTNKKPLKNPPSRTTRNA
jgi:NAD-dependent SIR2 family protein deacetylase